MAIEKSWTVVPPQLFTMNGTTLGEVNLVSTAGFKVKQTVVIQSSTVPPIQVQVKRVQSPTLLIVGPLAENIHPTIRQQGNMLLSVRQDISAYTVADGAFIYATEQEKVRLKPDDIIQAVYDQEPTVAIRTVGVDQFGNYFSSANPVPVSFDGTIAIGDVSIVEGGNTMTVNTDGSIDINIEGLSSFQTSQYTVGTAPVQITPTPMPDRSSIGFKAVSTSTNAIYIGNSASVNTSTGYPLFNGDTLEMDLEGTETIYAIATAAGQTLCVVELGD